MTTKEKTVQDLQVPLPGGTLVQRHYIVESLLGKGDFGNIYLLRDRYRKQKLFALAEVFNPNAGESYRFALEYVAPTSLDHQILPRTQNVFDDDKPGRTYVLMSYIEEPTLEILRLQQPQKRFPLPKVMAFMIPIINALDYLHNQNPPVIHQNINPTNIIISRMLNSPVLIMLDLLKEGDLTTTTLHSFAPGYSAPEQYRKEISIRTELYALGATCYTLLTGIIPPDALYRFSQLNEGKIDPLKPLNEALPTLPTFIVEAIYQSMSLNADDRFSSVQQFEQVLVGNLKFQESSTLKSGFILPEQNLPMKADSVEQKPLGTMIAPTSTTQTDLVEQQLPEPILAPSVPTVQQEPVPEVPPLLAVTKELPTPEIGPPVSIAQQPPVPEEVALIAADCELPTPGVGLSTTAAEESPVLEAESSVPKQSSIIPDKAVEVAAESLPRRTHTVLSRKPDISQPASPRQAVEKTDSASESKQSRSWKPGVLLILIAFMFIFGITTILWSDRSGYPIAHSGAPTQNAQVSKLTHRSVLSIYPMLTGTYGGTIYDLSRTISTSILLTDMRQSQGNISGYLILGSKLQGSGHFSGTISTTKELKFVVTDTVGNEFLFFEGAMQSGTSLTGDYYRCSPVGLSQGGQCKQAPGSYGIWEIVLDR